MSNPFFCGPEEVVVFNLALDSEELGVLWSALEYVVEVEPQRSELAARCIDLATLVRQAAKRPFVVSRESVSNSRKET